MKWYQIVTLVVTFFTNNIFDLGKLILDPKEN